jgi:hypothetical protein
MPKDKVKGSAGLAAGTSDADGISAANGWSVEVRLSIVDGPLHRSSHLPAHDRHSR